MTTQESPRWRGEGGRLVLSAGHYSYYAGAAWLITALVNDALGRPGWLAWPATVPFFAWFAALAAKILYHDSHLCERCIAATPLDPQAAVTRWKPWLHLQHQHRRTIGLCAVALVLFLVPWPWHWLKYALDAAGMLALGVIWFAEYHHRRLYPWCPWCHWGGGGDEEVVPEPAPDTEKV